MDNPASRASRELATRTIERARASRRSVVVTVGYDRRRGVFGAREVNGYDLPLQDDDPRDPLPPLLAERRALWSALAGHDDIVLINVLDEMGYRLVAVVPAPNPIPFAEGDDLCEECGEEPYGPEQVHWAHLWAHGDRVLYFVLREEGEAKP